MDGDDIHSDPVFRGRAQITWTEFWEQLPGGQRTPEHIRELIRYLMQCEGQGDCYACPGAQNLPLNYPRDTVDYDKDWRPFLVYFPDPDKLVQDVEYLNDRRCFWYGAFTQHLEQIMTVSTESYYSDEYIRCVDSDAENKTFQRGDFIARPSKRIAGKLVLTYLGNPPGAMHTTLKHAVIFDGHTRGILDPETNQPVDHLVVDGVPETRRAAANVCGLRGLIDWLWDGRVSPDLRRGCGQTVTPPLSSVSFEPLGQRGGVWETLRSQLQSLAQRAAERRLNPDKPVDDCGWEALSEELKQRIVEEVGIVEHQTVVRQHLRCAHQHELKKLKSVYLDQRTRLLEQNEAAWSELAALAADAAARFPGPSRQQNCTNIVGLYAQAGHAKLLFDEWLATFPKRCDRTRGSVKVLVCARLKCPFRAVEKAALAAGDARHDLARVADVVRGMLVFEDQVDFAQGLRCLLEDSDFVVTRVKDRITETTSGGWADVLMNGHMQADPHKHQCEVQLSFDRMRVVRSHLGGHEDYVRFRSSGELLCAAGFSPDEDDRPTQLRHDAAALRGEGNEQEAQRLEEIADRLQEALTQLEFNQQSMKAAEKRQDHATMQHNLTQVQHYTRKADSIWRETCPGAQP
eukprot:TRINITY_DN6831_c0_g1_i1.p1 TRINITY_DN6831_c0_g1~~TRINITY_DN6831_c0_g1_i1.p1  ORF type:complete len:643 (+),score=140.33 TRINITY_DN6831_c0_g1_i1:42-1931(+)